MFRNILTIHKQSNPVNTRNILVKDLKHTLFRFMKWPARVFSISGEISIYQAHYITLDKNDFTPIRMFRETIPEYSR